ncbi:hypothetical protein [Mucilaginibacter sp. KACC 22063]|nr:hypothetical protein [Mucilaginibacter sp. KACC 22063]WDF55791.1 hypothetical protein PQ461_01785 [Mucilaginibacter sp. KACC 22063]
MPAMQQPEAYIGDSETLFKANGDLIKESTQIYLQKFMQAFSDWFAS